MHSATFYRYTTFSLILVGLLATSVAGISSKKVSSQLLKSVNHGISGLPDFTQSFLEISRSFNSSMDHIAADLAYLEREVQFFRNIIDGRKEMNRRLMAEIEDKQDQINYCNNRIDKEGKFFDEVLHIKK